MAEQRQEHPLDRAERLVDEAEAGLVRLAKVAVARGIEVAEDVWAEAQALRSDDGG